MGKKRDATPKELAALIPVRTSEQARALSARRWNTVRPPAFKGVWADLFDDNLAALLETYGDRGPQYKMLAELSAGLFVQIKRMEATGAIRGLESLDKIIARMTAHHSSDDVEADEKEAVAIALAAQSELFAAAEAVKVYLRAIEAIRKLIDQAQRYTEARKAEIVVVEVNSAVVEVLRIVEPYVAAETFVQIVRAVRARIES